MTAEEPQGIAHDPGYLRDEQYRDSSNLDARKALHFRYSVNQYGWFRWLFDHFDLPAVATLLELGTGPGDLWAHNLERLPGGWTITLSDFSQGMLEAAKTTLGDAGTRFGFRKIDAQAIPFPDTSLDAVIANHMLYHVPDRPQALAEIRRVLKPGGALYAATNSESNMQHLGELIRRAGVEYGEAWSQVASLPFTLENGRAQLTPHFSRVDLYRREDALVVTDVEPLVAYVRSGSKWFVDSPALLDAFRRLLEREIRKHGAIRIEKDTGLFVARK